MQRTVYADNGATTALSKTVLDAMMPYLTEYYGNASSIYRIARESRRAVEDSRIKIARAIGADPSEIYFTSGGTEADNWAIKGALSLKKGDHFITSAVEHPAIIEPLKALEKQGCSVTYLPVDGMGRVDPEQVRAAITERTALITIMFANNEIGTIMPVERIGAIAREAGVPFHTDAVQAAGHMPIDVGAMNIDMLSMSGHKFTGPKGVGALYVRKGLRLPALLHGGGHERGLRSGTENVPGIVGLAAALEEEVNNLGANAQKILAMRKRLDEGILKIPYTRITGDPINRLPGTGSYVIEFIEGESMVLSLDAEGICASSGSACSSGSLDPSHVLLAIGLPHESAHGSLRLTINQYNTDGDIDYILDKLPPIIARLRKMSPLWEG